MSGADSEPDLRRLALLIEETSAAQGVDYYAVEVCGKSATEWAGMTGRDRSTVSRNVRRASDFSTNEDKNAEGDEIV